MSWEGRHSSDRPRCLLPVIIVEFSRLFKIQRPLSPSSRDTSWTEGQARMTKIPRGLKMFLSLTNVLLGAAQIITPIFSAWKLEPIASTLFSRFSKKKDLNKESEKNLSWLFFFFVIISLFVCWSTFKAGYRDPQVRFLDIPKCLFMAAVKGGWEGRGCGDIAMQCTG